MSTLLFTAVFFICDFASGFPSFAETKPDQRVVVISDLNGSYGSTHYGKDVDMALVSVTALKPDVVLATGDLVAGQKQGLDYRAMWQSFHQHVTLPLEKNQIPFAVAVGNHDGSGYDRYLQEREIFIDEWKHHVPQVSFSDASLYPVFYSFLVGETLFIALDTTQVGPLRPDQLDWIEKELQAHPTVKNRILFAHVPLFHFADIPLGESYYDEGLMKLIRRYQVLFYLTGHHHSYYPGYAEGTHFISQSCLGSGPTTLNGRNQVSEKSFTVIDFYSDRYEIYALKAPLFLEKVDHRTLPAEITAKGRTLKRKDSGFSP